MGIPPDLEAIHPNIRVQDRDMYFREYPDRLAVGGYGHVPLPVDAADLLHPREAPVMPSVLAFTPDTFAETWSWAEELVPALRPPEARIERGINGIFSFTTDGFPLMGESPDIGGFWLAEAVWVTHALGVGRGDGRVARRRRLGDRSPRVRPEPVRDAPAGAGLHPRPRHPELRRGLRHRPPAPADGGPAADADLAVLRAGAGARRVLPGGRRLGAAALVRGQRAAARPVRRRDPRSQRLGGPLLAPDRGRGGEGDARRRGDVRRDAAQADRGRGTRGPGVPRRAHDQPARPPGRDAWSTASCSIRAVASAAT